MRAIVSGGRTGGHLIPGISLYEEIKKRNIDCRYVMSAFDLNYPVTGRIGEKDRFLLPLKSLSRKISLKTPVYLYKILVSFIKIFGLIKKYNPDFIAITGGYISNPVALSAVILRKPLYIIEQNSVAGITNRFYSVFSRMIFTSFPDTQKVPSSKTIFTGNPTLHHEKIDREKARKFFQIGNFERIVGVTGGSQGSRVINECISDLLPVLLKNRIGIIWSIGSVEYKRLMQNNLIDKLKNDYSNARIYQFIERMDAFFSAVDCVISRAGASSITECIYHEIPLVMVPIKNSPDNHQEKNALYITSNGGGIKIGEDDLTHSLLIEQLNLMLKNLEFYKNNMKAINSSRPERPERDIVDRILADIFGIKCI
jgi:UDP-N-acetylglucosamine--N-acetylmuramyl-(pentapeptide) pyrophosphoryl-undecaprenol N-acetylglucosamine transferase